jgi:hypothetical protein
VDVAACDSIAHDQSLAYVMSIVTISCIIVYIISFAIGLGPIPMYITSEMFRQVISQSCDMVIMGYGKGWPRTP